MKFKRKIAAICFIAALNACGSADGVDDTEHDVYADSTSIWTPGVVPVCWENPSAGNATERGWVRDAIQNSWEKESAIQFIGWGTCPASSSGLRIQISDGHPHTRGLGDELDGVDHGMLLNFTFNNWGTICGGNNREYCIRTIAVHEFGHAIGFAHEQNRPDTPTWCDDEQGSDGDIMVGAWDLNSVMNYCNPAWSGNGELSAGDIAGVREFYGVPNTSQRVIYGLPLARYQSTFDDFVADGYRPISVDLNTTDIFGVEAVYVNAIFTRDSSVSWSARHGMSGSTYQSEFDARVEQGYRLAHLDTYTTGGSIRYAAIFERRGGSFTAYHGLSAAAHQLRFDDLVSRGYRPVAISPARVGGVTYYAALYDRTAVGSFRTLSGLTSAQYQAEFDANIAAGRRLAYLTTYQHGDSPRFSAIWNSAPLSSWVARHGNDLASFRDRHIAFTERSRTIRIVTSYQSGSSRRFAGMWAE